MRMLQWSDPVIIGKPRFSLYIIYLIGKIVWFLSFNVFTGFYRNPQGPKSDI
jgi:hypothetical protein